MRADIWERVEPPAHIEDANFNVADFDHAVRAFRKVVHGANDVLCHLLSPSMPCAVPTIVRSDTSPALERDLAGRAWNTKELQRILAHDLPFMLACQRQPGDRLRMIKVM